MGVRGLATYVSQNSDRFFDSHELHDCNLVIDGDSLSSNLYQGTSGSSSAFGGNYDQYFRTVCNFFEMLSQCNINAYVLLDGGYQPKKLNTVRGRLRMKIGVIKHLNPFNTIPMFPLMMREVFVEAMQHCKVKYMRCIFEADDEVAALARRIKCPVLSNDSDFYIHDVTYIPINMLDLRVFRRNIPSASGKSRQRSEKICEMFENGELKRLKVRKVETDRENEQKISYYYMDCFVYKIENLVRDRKIHADLMPLLAILLGNDYIKSSLFKKFFSNVSMKRTGKKNSMQAKRIVAIFRWLQNETLQSAVAKILGHVEKEKKEWLKSQMEIAMNGYSSEQSSAFEFFGLKRIESNSPKSPPVKQQYSVDEMVKLNAENVEDAQNEEENEQESNDSQDEEDGECQNENGNDDMEVGIVEPPDWLRNKILIASFPRQFIDLVTLKLYVNSPQVENFALKDSNLIAIDILRLIFTILIRTMPNSIFRYLTRVEKRIDIQYLRFESFHDDIQFNPNEIVNINTFKFIFKDFEKSAEILNTITTNAHVPIDLRLFLLTIIYWSKQSNHLNIVYISSLIICYIVLTVIDDKIEPNRSRIKFERAYQPEEIKKQLPISEPMHLENKSMEIDNYIKSIPKNECILAQFNLLEYFEVNARMRTKHTEFSSDIMHGYAELQSIIFQMNTLNILCGKPFHPIPVARFINGCFLYNIYVALKERPNIRYYVQHFLFPNSPTIFGLFEAILEFLSPFVQCIQHDSVSKKKKNRNIRKKKAREARKKDETNIAEIDHENVLDSDESEFEDLNNKFSCLLMK